MCTNGDKGTSNTNMKPDELPGIREQEQLAEANAGCEKSITYKRGKQAKKLMVKIPPGVKAETKIRLKGIRIIESKKSDDLYLHIKVKS